MSMLSYSAFDPILYASFYLFPFPLNRATDGLRSWLHHTNVDRLTAIYQAIHPGSYLTPSPENSGTFTIVPGPNSTLSTPLAPFSLDKQGDFYTSATSQSLSTFGYTYPEIQDWNQSPQQLQAIVISKVNALYGPSSPNSKRAIAAPGSNVTEWSVAVSVSKFALNGRRFIIRIFLDSVPDDAKSWATSMNCVGSFAVLPPPSRVAGPLPDTKIYNEISLVEALEARGYDGQDIDATVAYLTGHLQWRVQTVGAPLILQYHCY
jgi:tyrosinase